jgi:hypothetical protein
MLIKTCSVISPSAGAHVVLIPTEPSLKKVGQPLNVEKNINRQAVYLITQRHIETNKHKFKKTL